MAKDVRTADDMAHALGIATPMADLCAQLWETAARDWARRRITQKCCDIWRAGRVSVRRALHASLPPFSKKDKDGRVNPGRHFSSEKPSSSLALGPLDERLSGCARWPG
jgi:hypothetical protein